MDDSFEKTIKIVLVILLFAFSFGTPAVRWVIVGTIVLSVLFLALLFYFGNLALKRKEEKARVIAEKYPFAFEKYKRDHNLKAQVSDWKSKDRKEFFSWKEKEWELLQQEEEKRIALERANITQINEEFRSIESDAPNGLNNWISKNNFCLSSKVMRDEIKHLPETNSKGQKIITKEDVIINKDIILQYEEANRQREKFNDWSSAQKQFSKEIVALVKKEFSYLGRYVYSVPVKLVNEEGDLYESSQSIWQLFFHSYCLDEQLDYTHFPEVIQLKKYLLGDCSAWTSHTIRIYPHIIEDVLKALKEKYEDLAVIVYNDNLVKQLIEEFFRDTETANGTSLLAEQDKLYARTIVSLGALFDEEHIPSYDNSDLGNSDIQNKKLIVITNHTTTNEIINFTQQLWEHYPASRSCISFLSLFKEFSAEEMQALIDKKNKAIAEEEEKSSKEQEVPPGKDINPARTAVIHRKEEGASDCDVIISKPNPKQVDDLRIRYSPCDTFNSSDIYPLVSTPGPNSLLKLPRQGRSDIRGYKEPEFLAQLQASLTGISISDNFHLRIPGRFAPYEPDIVLYDEEINLYIDVEIDEPYNGYNRLVTHIIEGNDAIRDVFFKESGWVVVRFSEKQVHFYSGECIRMLENIIAVMRGEALPTPSLIEKEPRWARKQAIEWEKELYREKYLGIQFFSRQDRTRKIMCLDKPEGIDLMIVRTPVHRPVQIEQQPLFKQTEKAEPRPLPQQKNPIFPDPVKAAPFEVRKPTELCFDEHSHSYYNPCDMTGNSDRISVTTLIERFFPHFDEEAYIKKRMDETGMAEDEVRKELAEPSERGTDMHKQIENYLKGLPYDGSSREFQFFLRFHEEQIVRRGLTFDSAEYPIELKGSNIAGTVDALFRKPDGNYVMVDWKRSKHLIIDGYPKKYGFGCGLSVLSHLDNSSYYKYELQQSFYKYILEKDYGIRVSSMILAVLYPEYDRYYTVKLSQYRRQEVLDMIECYESTL